MLDARDLAVPARRGFDPLDRAIRAGIRPGVLLAVVGAREADLFEFLSAAVVLPAVDRAVLVLVDFDTDDAGAVHVAPGVDLAVAVRVVLQERQFSRFPVVLRSDSLPCLVAFAVARGREQRRRSDEGRGDEGL